MFFGIKDTDGVNGNEQLVTTIEYHDNMGVKYPEVISIVPVTVSGKKKFKYTVKDYFRKYNTPAESFEDHCKFFLTNPRYAGALAVKSDPYKFVEAVAKAGYATAPDYATTMKSMVDSIMRRMPK